MKVIYCFLGFVFLGLGVVGAAVPVLPTVPFLLLASFFFAKSSKSINYWFKSTDLYQIHLKDFVHSRTLTRKAKTVTLAFASCMLIAAFIFSKPLYAKVLILLVLILKYYYFIFKITTAPKDVVQTQNSAAAAAQSEDTLLSKPPEADIIPRNH